MSDLSGFTDELDEELRSCSEGGAVVESAPVAESEPEPEPECPHRLIFSGLCAECAPSVDCA